MFSEKFASLRHPRNLAPKSMSDRQKIWGCAFLKFSLVHQFICERRFIRRTPPPLRQKSRLRTAGHKKRGWRTSFSLLLPASPAKRGERRRGSDISVCTLQLSFRGGGKNRGRRAVRTRRADRQLLSLAFLHNYVYIG